MNLKLSLFAATLLISSTALSAAPLPCHDAVEVAKQLRAKYQEEIVAFGLQSNGNLLQIYSSEEKDTWTVVSTSPAGMSCIVAAGKRWETIPPPPPDGPRA